jgi:L-malate glycosyltransferase
MKILHTVEFYHPSVGGMQEVVKQLSERLASFGHEVTVATTRLPGRSETVHNGVRIAGFDVSGNLARGMRGEVEEYRRFLKESRFDVVTNFAAQQWATDAGITMLDEIPGKKVFVPTGFSGLYDPRYREYFDAMKAWLHRYDMNVFLSDHYRDIDFARESGVTKLMVIPNGASEEEFLAAPEVDIRRQLGIPEEHFLVLHVGSHTAFKGHAEAIRIFSRARMSNATLLIAANDVPGGCGRQCRLRKALFALSPLRLREGKRLIVTPLPRMETVAAYLAANLFLFPSNVECSPLVLFEAAASRTPFLSTDAGNAREIAGWTGGGSILPTRVSRKGYSRAETIGSARMLEGMWREPESRRALAEAGFAAWKERFTWRKLARDYEALYLGLLRENQV